MRTVSKLLIAASLMSAFIAAASSASAAEFHSEAEKTTFTGVSEAATVIDWAGATISCPSATYEGTGTTKTSPTLTTTANYNPGGAKCTFLIFGVTLNMNGCDYVFHANGEVDVAGGEACHGITFEGAGCKLIIPAQTGLNGVTYTNVGSGATREITVTPSITGIKYTATGLCPKTGTFTDGSITSGPFLLKGEVTGTTTQVGIWVQ